MTGGQLRQFRERLRLTQAEFAAKVGAAPNTVARWERGEIGMRPTTEHLVKLLMKQTDLTTPSLETPTAERILEELRSTTKKGK